MNDSQQTFPHCDGEAGVFELSATGTTGYVYTSCCSVPPQVWEDVYMIRVTQGCPCGCGEPQFGHPCIGHDEKTGRVLEGPAKAGQWFQINLYRSHRA